VKTPLLSLPLPDDQSETLAGGQAEGVGLGGGAARGAREARSVTGPGMKYALPI